MKGLAQKIIIGSATTGRLFAAGPLSKQPATSPFRVVLVHNQYVEYIVATEYFTDKDIIDNAEDGVMYSSHLAGGHYFGKDDLVAATKRFAEVVAAKAESLQSLYREDA